MLDFLPGIPEFTTMVLTTSDEAADLLKMGISSGNIINISASQAANLKNWVTGYLGPLGKEIDPEVLEYIITESNFEPAIVKNELDKMILISG